MPDSSLGGIWFADVAAVTCDRDAFGRVAVETPALHAANPNRAQHAYGRGPFARLGFATGEQRPGVFAVLVDGRLRYLGRTASLAGSFGASGLGRIDARACVEPRELWRCRVNGEIAQALRRGASVTVLFHPSRHAADLERSLIATLAPDWNDRSGAAGAVPTGVATRVRALHLAGRSVPEIAADLQIREAFAYRIVAKMAKHRFESESEAG